MPNNKNATAAKERLTYALIGQLFLIGVSAAALVLYILPKWGEINTKVEETNAEIATYEDAYTNGLKTQKILSLLAKDQKRQELYSLVQENNEETTKVIKKDGAEEEYLQWLTDNLQDNEEDIKKLQIMKAQMNSIVPTFSPITNTSVEETSVSLKDYVEFIENNLLTAYSIQSTSPVSIDKITYASDEEKSNMGKIGYIDMNIQFEGPNINIYKMLDYIYELGHAEILTNTGSSFETVDQVPAAMSNPLVTVESLTLNDEINIDEDGGKQQAENAGTMTLRFYVRGSNTSDANFLVEAVESRKTELQEKVAALKTICTENDICSSVKQEQLKNFETKWNEFVRMNGTITIDAKSGASTSDMSRLAEQISTMRVLDEEFEVQFKSLIEQSK